MAGILDQVMRSNQQGFETRVAMEDRARKQGLQDEQMAARRQLAQRMGQMDPLGEDATIADIQQRMNPALQYGLQYGDPSAMQSINPLLELGLGQIEGRRELQQEKIKAGGKLQQEQIKQGAKALKEQESRDLSRGDKYNRQARQISKGWEGTPEYETWKGAKKNAQLIAGVLKDADKQKSGVGDSIATVLFNKALDPGSVVREGEYDRAAEYGGLLSKMRNLYNKYGKGQTLPPEVRAELIAGTRKLAKMNLEAAAQASKKFRYQHDSMATDLGFVDRVGNYKQLFGDEDPLKMMKEMEKEESQDRKRLGKFQVQKAMEDFVRRSMETMGEAPPPEIMERERKKFEKRFIGE